MIHTETTTEKIVKSEGNYGYTVYKTFDGEYSLTTFMNVAGINFDGFDITAWNHGVTTLREKTYKKIATAVKKGDEYLQYAKDNW